MHKETRNPKAVLQENLNTNIENKPSTKNTNEGDCYGQVPSANGILQA